MFIPAAMACPAGRKRHPAISVSAYSGSRTENRAHSRGLITTPAREMRWNTWIVGSATPAVAVSVTNIPSRRKRGRTSPSRFSREGLNSTMPSTAQKDI